MISLYYGQSSYCRNTELKIKVKSLLNKNRNATTKYISFDDDNAVFLFKEAVEFRDLFFSNDKINIIILSNTKEISNKDKSIVIDLLKKSEVDSSIICYLNENIKKKTLPVYINSILKNIKYEKYFFDVISKNEALKYIKKDLELEGYSISSDALSKLYEFEDGNLFSVVNNAKKLSFLKYSPEKLLEFISKEYTTRTTINDFSKALIYNKSLAYKLYMLESFFSKNSFYNGVIAYLSKVTNDGKIIKKLANEDIKIKSGLLEPESAILELIINS